ncbi:transporter substrate-binding domain-containing protein [Phycicoccus sp. M110.8]|uniref:transporter substrate-binding domain-containing protein n=1 Tax=Phycicoccus sp. M110.8 TaxID=3075433 RepID=UPI0028FD74A7|nr:transporter substrate-binding domain-containing protein [Phycicoccus sp. M110.8]MDU0314487.1 transporter substrate-binding domain-containing protein [Phycicoccus sp. M110.8]
MTSTPDTVVGELAPTGALRVSINLGNPVLAQGDSGAPRGVTVDIARELGRRLGVPVQTLCFDAARKSYEAMADGRADLCFLAVDPAREEQVAFTRPYVAIEGVYVVREESPVRTAQDVDRAGVRVGVKEGSAYDLHLTRELTGAEVVRGSEGVDVFVAEGLEVGAGIRQPVEAFVDSHAGYRVAEPAFMQIRQAVGTPRGRSEAAVAGLDALVGDLVAEGFVARSLERSGQSPTLVADGRP